MLELEAALCTGNLEFASSPTSFKTQILNVLLVHFVDRSMQMGINAVGYVLFSFVCVLYYERLTYWPVIPAHFNYLWKESDPVTFLKKDHRKCV